MDDDHNDHYHDEIDFSSSVNGLYLIAGLLLLIASVAAICLYLFLQLS